MSILDDLNKIRTQSKITIVIALMSLLTIGAVTQLNQSNALDLDGVSDINGLSDIGLSNTCVAFECNNQQTVDNSKTITGNTNSNIVSDSDNTNIGTASTNSSQPNGPVTSPCVKCFEDANLTPAQEQTIFEVYGVTSFEELCNTLSGGDLAVVFEQLSAHIDIDDASAIVNCLLAAGVLVSSG